MVRLPCSNPTPAGLLASDHCDTAAWPLVCKKQRLPRLVFRSSIAWLSDWLSTLRGVSYLSTTQDSLPVAGQALPDGILTRKVPMKGFKVADYISFPLPKLLGAIAATSALWLRYQLASVKPTAAGKTSRQTFHSRHIPHDCCRCSVS